MFIKFHNIFYSCQDHLQRHGINYKDNTYMEDVEIKLPKLEGKDIVEHFYNIGEKQCAPYRDIIKSISSSYLPPLPKVC